MRVFASVIAALVLWTALTFAGMAVFGMHGGEGALGMGPECVEHCLGLVPDGASAPSIVVPAAVFVAMAVVMVAMGMLPVAQGIAIANGEYALRRRHRDLRTIVLRN